MRVWLRILEIFMGLCFLALVFIVFVLYQWPPVRGISWITEKFADNISVIVMALVPLSTLILAYIAVRSSIENRSLINEEIIRKQHSRRIEEIEHWIDEVGNVKSECATPTGSREEWRSREIHLRVALSRGEYAKLEATRLDSEFRADIALEGLIDSLLSIFDQFKGIHITGLSNEQVQENVENEILSAFEAISNLKELTSN